MRNYFAYFCVLILFLWIGIPQTAVAEIYLTPKDVVFFSKMRHQLVARNFIADDKNRLEILNEERLELMRKIEYLRRTGRADLKQENKYHIHLSLYPEDVQNKIKELSNEILEIDNQIVEMKRLNAFRIISNVRIEEDEEKNKNELHYADEEKRVKLPFYIVPNRFFIQHQRRQQRLYRGYRANITQLPQAPEI